MSCRIDIRGLKVYAYHGVAPQEAVIGNDFEVDAVLEVEEPPALLTDNIADTINYADIVALIEEEMKVRSQLLEHVAGRICRRLKAAYPAITSGRVTVWKLLPPITARLDRIGFTVEF